MLASFWTTTLYEQWCKDCACYEIVQISAALTPKLCVFLTTAGRLMQLTDLPVLTVMRSDSVHALQLRSPLTRRNERALSKSSAEYQCHTEQWDMTKEVPTFQPDFAPQHTQHCADFAHAWQCVQSSNHLKGTGQTSTAAHKHIASAFVKQAVCTIAAVADIVQL